MSDKYMQTPRGSNDAYHPDEGEDHREQPTMTGRKTGPKPEVAPVRAPKSTLGPRGRNG